MISQCEPSVVSMGGFILICRRSERTDLWVGKFMLTFFSFLIKLLNELV